MDDQTPSVFRDTDTAGQGDYVVARGDCLHSIADEHGFFWKTIWQHPDNSALRDKRGDPMVILPGDRLTIPEVRTRKENGATDARHRFRRRGIPAKLKLQFTEEGEPLADCPCIVTIDGASAELITDGDGRLDIPISPRAREGSVRIREDDGDETEYQLDLGDLDPHATVRGVQQRLQNLGLYQGEVDGRWSAQVAGAIEAFRVLHGLEDEDELSEDTLRSIRDVHGS